MKKTIIENLKKAVKPVGTITGLVISGCYIGVASSVEYLDATLLGGIILGAALAIVSQFAKFEN